MTYVLGIAVGAMRTVAAVARPDHPDVQTVDLDGGAGVASVLHLAPDGTLAVGAEAERRAATEPDRVVRGFAERVGDGAPMLLAGEPWAPEELTAWLVRWVVDRVAEQEGAAAAIALAHPATWDAHRLRLFGDALAEQDLAATFVASAIGTSGAGSSAVGPAQRDETEAAARAAALTLRDAGVAWNSPAHGSPALSSGPAPLAHDPLAGAHRSGRFPETVANGALSGGGGVRAGGATASGGHARPDSVADGPAGSGRFAVPADVPTPGSHRSGAHRPEGATTTLDADLVGLSGATNTAGLLSGYTPARGTPASRSGDGATTVTATGATRRSGRGWAAVAEHHGDDSPRTVDVELPAAPASRATPSVLVSVGGAAAAVAVVGTLFLWPAPRTTNSASSRPVPPVPAAVAPVPTTPSVTAPETPTLDPTPTPRPRLAPPRTRRPAVEPAPAPPSAPQTTPAPSASTPPAEPTASPSASTSESAPASTSPEDD